MNTANNVLNLIAFPGAPNLPIFSALEWGFFSEAGVDIRLETTFSSIYQMEKLLDGNYQVAASRAWASLNEESLMGFIKGYLCGLRWTLNPNNYEAAKDLLIARMPAIKPTIVDRVMTKLFNPSTGLIPDGEFDIPGIKTVLSLRNRFTITKEKSTDLLTDIDAAYLGKA